MFSWKGMERRSLSFCREFPRGCDCGNNFGLPRAVPNLLCLSKDLDEADLLDEKLLTLVASPEVLLSAAFSSFQRQQ